MRIPPPPPRFSCFLIRILDANYNIASALAGIQCLHFRAESVAKHGIIFRRTTRIMDLIRNFDCAMVLNWGAGWRANFRNSCHFFPSSSIEYKEFLFSVFLHDEFFLTTLTHCYESPSTREAPFHEYYADETETCYTGPVYKAHQWETMSPSRFKHRPSRSSHFDEILRRK